MGKKLVIVESPAKAKTINKILGGDYTVKASLGHVRDLPVRRLGVEIERGFKPSYEVVKGREKVVQELTAAAEKAEHIYLAPDPDREGEAIAWHLQTLLEKVAEPDRFHRVTYNEITPRAVRAAFEHPRKIDQRLVDAQQARRVLDRLVGYKVSPLLWRRVQRGTSAGRVQSVALRLVCEREQAIRAFVPEPYWVMGAEVRKQVEPRDPFRVRLARINDAKAEIKSAERAETLLRDLATRALRVKDVTIREVQRRPFPPLITSTLQQAASRLFNFTPARTMRIAQRLYEGVDLGAGPVGLITYMRTDSFAIAPEAQAACRELIAERFGPEYVPATPHVYRKRAGAQEAHEAIRPTDVRRTPEELTHKLSPEELKIYGLIWRQFVASQMAAARLAQKTVEVETVPVPEREQYLFRATASEIVFPGFLKLTEPPRKARPGESEEPEKEKAEPEEAAEVERLPPLEVGEPLDVVQWLSERKETQPPPRYTEATLIRALEEDGVGRPSTYAQILTTLYERRYVTREKKALVPTKLGEQVNALLVQHLDALFDVKFTAEMEAELDRIEEGTVQWTRMLEDFYARFTKWMDAARGPDADPQHVRGLLAALEQVRAWEPEVRHGRRVYSDQKFVESLRRQAEAGTRPLSPRQLASLGRLVLKYKSQIGPAAETALREAGLGHLSDAPPTEPPRPAVLKKLALLEGVRLTPPATAGRRRFDEAAFVASLRQQVARGRTLSPAQIRVLDRLVLRHADQIPNFAAVKAELELGTSDAPDHESGLLLEQLRQVTHWDPPAVRGQKTRDDRAFYESLRRQYETRHSLSPRQRAALQRLVKKYVRHPGQTGHGQHPEPGSSPDVGDQA